MLVIDNGPQYYSAELSAFAWSWCFEKVTSSPKLPKVFREYQALLEWAERQRRDLGLFLRNGLWDVAAKLCDQLGAAYRRNLRSGGQIHSKKTGAKEETIPDNH